MITSERKQAFLKKAERVSAYREVRNLMAEAADALNCRSVERIRACLVQDESMWIEFADEGRFNGPEAVDELLAYLFSDPPGSAARLDLMLTTPIVEIAGDGKTAQGVWWCPVPMTIRREDGKEQAVWAWGTIAADFLRCGAEWKIWHLHYFRVFKCRYADGWVDDLSMINRLNLPALPHSQPLSYHNPYSPLSVRDGIPAAPRPYESYTDAMWMTETRKDR